MTNLKILVVAVMLMVVSACGYHLAGKADLDPVFEKTHVSYQGRGRAVAELIEKQFQSNKYQIVPAEQASAVVKVLYETTNKEILSLDDDGKVREYELILRVGFNVQDAEGNVLIKNQEVRLSRDFLFEINELLGNVSEEQKIYQEMRADASRLILYRLQAVSVNIEDSTESETSDTATSQE